jgi:hypothetical protein
MIYSLMHLIRTIYNLIVISSVAMLLYACGGGSSSDPRTFSGNGISAT